MAMMNRIEPIRLKKKWTMAARLAFFVAPMDDSMDVQQVPMFWPMMMGSAAA